MLKRHAIFVAGLGICSFLLSASGNLLGENARSTNANQDNSSAFVRIAEQTTSDSQATQPRQANDDSTATPPVNSPVENPLGYLRAEKFDEITKRPLFSPDRRPPRKPKKTVAKPLPSPPPPTPPPGNIYKLLGVVSGEGRSYALVVEQKRGLNYRVQAGDLIDGWNVTRIAGDRVILERNGQKQVLSISTAKAY